MTEPTRRAYGRHVVVAGAAGGVGTTTVAALVALAHAADGGAVTLVDHSGGGLAARMPDGWAGGAGDLVVQDVGAHPAAAAEAVAGRDALLLLVASSTPAAAALLPAVLARLADLGDQRLRVVLTRVHGGRRPTATALRSLGREPLVLPRDDALAAGGPLVRDLLSRRTRRAAADLARAVGVLGTGADAPERPAVARRAS